MRQRLVGILVIGCLAVIIIPMLLDGEGIQPPPLSATIPAEPAFPEATIAEPTRPVIIADSLPAEAGSEILDANAAEDATAEPAVASDDEDASAAPLPVYEPEQETALASTASASTAPASTASEQDDSATDALEAAVAAIMKESRTQAATSADATPRLDASGLPAAYVVRLGSFGEKANADALVKQLLAAEYKAYSRSVTTAGGVFNAVYVGPVITRAEATDLRNTLSGRFQLNGVVENFTMQQQ